MKKKRFDDVTRAQAIGTAVILIVVLLLVFLVLYWMYSVKLLILPEPIAKLLGLWEDEGGEMPWDLGELTDMVRDERHPDVTTVSLDLTYENLLAAFLSEKQAEGIYINGKVSYFDDGKAVDRRVTLRRKGSCFNATIYKNNNSPLVDTIKISDGSVLFINDVTNSESRKIPLGDFTYEAETGIPSIAQVIEAVEAFPTEDKAQIDGDEQNVNEAVSLYTDCELKLLKTAEGSVYFVKFTDSELGISEEYLVSLEHAVVLSANTVVDGEQIYSFRMQSFSVEPHLWEADELYNTVG